MPDPHDDRVPIARQRGEPVVVTLDESLTQHSMQRLRTLIRDVSGTRPVIIDLTTIPGFDSQGTTDLLALQDELGTERVAVVGLRQAAARLFGLAAMAADTQTEDTQTDDHVAASSRVLPTPGMVFLESKSAASPQLLNSTLQAAIARDIAIVIVDLESVAVASIEVLAAIRSASLAAAMHGQELVLVNVGDELARLLNRVGLAATTYLAATR